MIDMKNNIFKTTLLLIYVVLSSCEREDPLAEEQYIKQIYMVGAYQGVFNFDIRYSADPQNGYVSVATGGTLPIEEDLAVTLAEDNTAIGLYNDKYMRDNAPVKYQRLPAAFFNMPSMTGLIKKGEAYSRIPFSVNTQNLHCDSLYAVAFNIASVSAYQKNSAIPTLILNLRLNNEYSGSYNLQAVKYTVTPTNTQTPETAVLSEPASIGPLIRTLKAVNINTVRFFNEATQETRSGYNTNELYWKGLKDFGVTFSLKPGSTSEFDVASWVKYSTGSTTGGLNILAGKATYEDGVFTFWYDYMEGTVRRRMQGTLKRQ